MQLKQISMQLLATFVEVEAEDSITRFDKTIPVLTQTLQDGVADDKDEENRSDSENEAENGNETQASPMNDKCLYNALLCIGKIFAKVPDFLTSKKYTERLTKFMGTFIT